MFHISRWSRSGQSKALRGRVIGFLWTSKMRTSTYQFVNKPTVPVELLSRKTLPVQNNAVWVGSSTKSFNHVDGSKRPVSEITSSRRLVNQKPRSPQAFKTLRFCYGPASQLGLAGELEGITVCSDRIGPRG